VGGACVGRGGETGEQAARRRRIGRAVAAVLGIASLLACSRPPIVGPIAGTAAAPGETSRVAGALEWPVRGALVSAYRPPARPTHAGVDLAAPPGTPVVAAEAGEVVFAGQIRGYDGVIAIAHAGDLTTVYAHLGDLRLAEGTAVSRGEPIGTIGSSGYLHYEIRRAKQPIDPADLYAIGPSLGDVAPGSEGTPRLADEPAADVPLGAPRAPAPRSARAGLVTPPPPSAPPPVPVEKPAARAPELAPGTLGGSPVATPAATIAPPAANERADPGPGALGRDAAATSSATPASDGGVALPLVIGANLLYVPAKAAYSAVGAVTGLFVLGFSQNPEVAERFWTQTLGGDFFLTAEHLSGERGVRWMGETSD
jgi:hypothetical protein